MRMREGCGGLPGWPGRANAIPSCAAARRKTWRATPSTDARQPTAFRGCGVTRLAGRAESARRGRNVFGAGQSME
jgi:hypothetical protein